MPLLSPRQTLGVYAHDRAKLTHKKSGLDQKYIDTTKFALACTIMGMLVKFATTYVLYRDMKQLGGDLSCASRRTHTHTHTESRTAAQAPPARHTLSADLA